MKMTSIQFQVSGNLERLVHHRMTKQELNNELSKIFNQHVEVERGDIGDDWQGDDFYTFSIDDKEIGGYFDIYYISMPHRNEMFYITEVNYCFE